MMRFLLPNGSVFNLAQLKVISDIAAGYRHASSEISDSESYIDLSPNGQELYSFVEQPGIFPLQSASYSSSCNRKENFENTGVQVFEELSVS
ncbi:hypothetical protein ACVBEF_01545 [Glaciimonas sp. GG7]